MYSTTGTEVRKININIYWFSLIYLARNETSSNAYEEYINYAMQEACDIPTLEQVFNAS